MSTDIRNLIDTWANRPPRVEADDVEHLTYIFTRLLPALRDAMLDIENLTSQTAGRAADSPSPSNAPSPEPSPAPNSHTPAEIPNTADNAAASGQTADRPNTSASLPSSAALPAKSGQETTGRAKPKRARTHAPAPQAAPPETA